jgi:hypothetical protein
MTRNQNSQNEECWILSPNPTNTHSDKHDLWSDCVTDIDDSTGIGHEFLKKKIPHKKNHLVEMGISKKAGKTLEHTKEQTPLLFLSGNLQENLETSPCPPFSRATRHKSHREKLFTRDELLIRDFKKSSLFFIPQMFPPDPDLVLFPPRSVQVTQVMFHTSASVTLCNGTSVDTLTFYTSRCVKHNWKSCWSS